MAVYNYRPKDCETNTAVQSQKAVSAYFKSKQILPFGFAEQNTPYLFNQVNRRT